VPMTADALAQILSSDAFDSGAFTTVPCPPPKPAPSPSLRWRKSAP